MRAIDADDLIIVFEILAEKMTGESEALISQVCEIVRAMPTVENGYSNGYEQGQKDLYSQIVKMIQVQYPEAYWRFKNAGANN